MFIDITSNYGHIFIGNFSLLWENPTEQFTGFFAISGSVYSLEFGEIDSGNGIFLTKYGDGNVEYTKPLLLI